MGITLRPVKRGGPARKQGQEIGNHLHLVYLIGGKNYGQDHWY